MTRMITATLVAAWMLSLSQAAFALDLQLKGKTALITGSTAGIGFATAKALLNEGADVIINSRRQESCDKAAAELKAATGKTPKIFVGDMSKAADTDRLAKQYPNVDILINNVATFIPDEVASLIAYVASPLSSATTGSALRVDGGVVKSAF